MAVGLSNRPGRVEFVFMSNLNGSRNFRPEPNPFIKRRAVHWSKTGPAWIEDRARRTMQTEDRTEVLSVLDQTGPGKTGTGPDRKHFGLLFYSLFSETVTVLSVHCCALPLHNLILLRNLRITSLQGSSTSGLTVALHCMIVP